MNRRFDMKFGLILALVSSLWASAGWAHHILGLPHYSYKENYPQAPTLEYPATTGPFDVLLTCYPGAPVPQEPANVTVYIKNRNTSLVYQHPIEVRVLQTFTFGTNLEILPKTVVHPFDQPHKLSLTFPESGEYIVEVGLEVENQLEMIPFLVIAGDPTATGSILIALIILLFLFFITIRAIKIKRQRKVQKRLSQIDSTQPVGNQT